MSQDRKTPIEAHRRAQPPRPAPRAPEPSPGLRRVPTDPAIVDQVPAPDVLARPRFDRPRPPPLPAPTTAKTIPTPAAETVAVSALQGPPSSTLPPLSEDPEVTINEALRRRAEAAEARAAELERQARVAAETASPATFPPKVERRQSPIPVSVAPESKAPDRAAWAKLGYRVAAAAVGAAILIIAALGFWAVAAINAKAEATKAEQAAKVKETETREEKWRKWATVAAWILDCRDKRDVKAGEMLLPDPQKMGAARKMEAWQNPCPVELPPPP